MYNYYINRDFIEFIESYFLSLHFLSLNLILFAKLDSNVCKYPKTRLFYISVDKTNEALLENFPGGIFCFKSVFEKTKKPSKNSALWTFMPHLKWIEISFWINCNFDNDSKYNVSSCILNFSVILKLGPFIMDWIQLRISKCTILPSESKVRVFLHCP